MRPKLYTLTQLAEVLGVPLTTVVMARDQAPLCPAGRDEYGRNLYSRRDVSLLYRYLIEHDAAALSDFDAAARGAYIKAIAAPGIDRRAALEAEFDRIVAGNVEATDEQISALLDALEQLSQL